MTRSMPPRHSLCDFLFLLKLCAVEDRKPWESCGWTSFSQIKVKSPVWFLDQNRPTVCHTSLLQALPNRTKTLSTHFVLSPSGPTAQNCFCCYFLQDSSFSTSTVIFGQAPDLKLSLSLRKGNCQPPFWGQYSWLERLTAYLLWSEF